MQICEALEAAHERGIIHRDLKPANIKITPDGKVKVLDFGLAKALDEGDPASLSQSPTRVTFSAAGVILGTAAYMSPEQAKGRDADRRSDIWAFGCILFEMLAGDVAFQGENVNEILASVMKTVPDWTLLPVLSTPQLRKLLERCLEKDRRRAPAAYRRRCESKSTTRQNSPAAADDLGVTAAAPQHRGSWIFAFLLLALIAADLAWFWRMPRPAAPPPEVRFELTTPPDSQPTFAGYITRRTADRFCWHDWRPVATVAAYNQFRHESSLVRY